MPALKYPVAYRNQAAREHSTPAPRPVPPFRPAPRPANDNWPRPANDNVRPRVPRNLQYDLHVARETANWRAAYNVAKKLVRGKNPTLDIVVALLDGAFNDQWAFPWHGPNGKFVSNPNLSRPWEFQTYGHADGLSAGMDGFSHEELAAMQANVGKTPEVGMRVFAPLTYIPAGIGPPWPQPAAIANQTGIGTGSSTFTSRIGWWQFHEGIGGAIRAMHLASWWKGINQGALTPAQIFNHPAIGPRILLPRVQPMPSVSIRPGMGRYKAIDLHNQMAPRLAPQTALKLPRVRNDKKFIIAFNNRAWYGQIVNAVTETVDVIDAAYDALGKKCGAKTPQAKISCLYKNWNTLDWGKFLQNLVENQIEDKFWGTIGQASGKAARRSGNSTGYQTGPWDTEFSYHANGFRLEIYG